MELDKRIAYARGEQPVDLLLKGGQVVNVFAGEVHPADVAIAEGWIVGLGDGYQAKEVVDVSGRFIAPGFIDGHVHLESSMVTVPEFTRAVLPHGTTTAVIDPHEIANVLGIDGINFVLESSKHNLLNVFVMLPSCVPATHLETAGAHLDAFSLAPLMPSKWVRGLGEMMNFPGVLFKDPEVLKKLQLAYDQRKVVDGHAPGLAGRELNAYIAAGVRSDHECTTVAEAREKLRRGMTIMIREGSGARNLDDLLPLVTEQNAAQLVFCTDDRHPDTIIARGHIDEMVRRAIAFGVAPITAYRMASFNAANYFRLPALGAILPGYRADILVLSDLKQVTVDAVYKWGKRAADRGVVTGVLPTPRYEHLRNAMNAKPVTAADFVIPAAGTTARVIGVVPGQIVTDALTTVVKTVAGMVQADPTGDILKIAVIDRHRAAKTVAVGLVKGFGLKRGALATSVAHDSHNIIVVGASDAEMAAAAQAVIAASGGAVVVEGTTVRAMLELPIAGLISPRPLTEVAAINAQLTQAAAALGCVLSDPFMTLSFLALPVIPQLKLTDKGLVDVGKFDFVPLFVD
ncbi:MAG TPA: adenine deaminase [bacterium]|nr:adenine deaminase [bacterium]